MFVEDTGVKTLLHQISRYITCHAIGHSLIRLRAENNSTTNTTTRESRVDSRRVIRSPIRRHIERRDNADLAEGTLSHNSRGQRSGEREDACLAQHVDTGVAFSTAEKKQQQQSRRNVKKTTDRHHLYRCTPKSRTRRLMPDHEPR